MKSSGTYKIMTANPLKIVKVKNAGAIFIGVRLEPLEICLRVQTCTSYKRNCQILLSAVDDFIRNPSIVYYSKSAA